MKYLTHPLIFLTLSFVFHLPLYADSVIISPTIELDKEKEIFAVCDTGNRPYEFLNEKGEPDGFSVELFKTVMERLGLKYRIKAIPRKEFSTYMNNCSSVVYIGVSYSPGKTEKALFSIPYATGNISIVSRAQDNYRQISDLLHKKIILKKCGKNFNVFVKDKMYDSIIPVNTVKEALVILSQGEGDAFVGTTAEIQHELKKPGIKNLVANTSEITPHSYSFAVDFSEKKLLNRINEELYTLMHNGEYYALHDKWLRDDDEPDIPENIQFGIMIGVAIILILISFVIVLRRQVKQVTGHLRKAKEEAEHNDYMKSVFLANMGKELMNPLNAIVGLSNILATETDKNEKQKYLSLIDSNSHQLIQLINNVIDLSKFEAGVMTLSKMTFDINTLCKDMISTRIEKCRLGDIRLHLDIDEDSIKVDSDQQKVCQAIDALLENAAKLTPQGDITLQTRREDNFVKVSVIDNGTGISETHLDKIFERYTRLDNNTDSTELNLALFKAIINSLGGEIGATSTVGKGSTFWFKLKLNEEKTKNNA